MITQCDIARKVGVDVSTVNKILNRRPGPVFSKVTIRKVFQAARELGFNLDRLKHQHRRDHLRKPASTPAQIEIYKQDGTLHECGEALVEDLSAGGARLARVRVPSGTFPIGGSIVLHLKGRPTPRSYHARVVRLCHANDSTDLGIRFSNGHGKRTT